MNSEEILLSKWRDLNADKQQKILNFLDFIWQKSLAEKSEKISDSEMVNQRVQRWIDWAESHPKNSPGLPDEALRRDSIYEDE